MVLVDDRAHHHESVNPAPPASLQVWWVHRTLYNFRVERRVPFRVISPLCDWDAVNGRYFPYATVGAATKLVGIQSFDPTRLLFTRPRKEGASHRVASRVRSARGCACMRCRHACGSAATAV